MDGVTVIERTMTAGDDWLVRVRCADRSDGDFRCHASSEASRGARQAMERRRQKLMGGRWTWLRQAHGAEVVLVAEPGGGAGAVADGAATSVPGAVLAVHTADCAPVVVAGHGALGIAHAGWRGVAAGVIGEVVAAVRGLAPSPDDVGLRAVIGPLIRPASYEFDAPGLAAVADAAGCDVGAVTAWGTAALDLGAAVRGALATAGVNEVDDLGLDTAGEGFFSHRIRGDCARHATAARLEPRP